MVMSVKYSGEKLEVKLTQGVYEVYLEVNEFSGIKETLWLKMRKKGTGTFWYIVGIQHDGSIARAAHCDGSGLPIDQRIPSQQKVAIRLLK
jgi:hypothetical protein